MDAPSLKSSVFGLNVKPSTVTFNPLKITSLKKSFLYSLTFCCLFTSTAALAVLNSEPFYLSKYSNALVSFFRIVLFG